MPRQSRGADQEFGDPRKPEGVEILVLISLVVAVVILAVWAIRMWA